MMPEHTARRVRAHVLADPSAVGAYAADIVGRACARAVRARGVFTLALSGGSTPLHLFRRLREPERMNTGLDWQRVRVFWVDERCVPPEHANSNFGLAWRELFVCGARRRPKQPPAPMNGCCTNRRGRLGSAHQGITRKVRRAGEESGPFRVLIA